MILLHIANIARFGKAFGYVIIIKFDSIIKIVKKNRASQLKMHQEKP